MQNKKPSEPVREKFCVECGEDVGHLDWCSSNDR